jgi:hypothetical protein
VLSGKKELFTILLAGLCLNLSTLHLHSIDQYLAAGENSGLHLAQDELPFCFACKHLSFGEISTGIALSPVMHGGEKPQIFAEQGIYDHTPALHLNKSPPGPAVNRSI